MGTILLRGRHVVGDPAALPDGGIIDDGGVLVSGRTIEAVGSFGELSRAHPDAEVIGSGSHLVIPGLVNATTMDGASRATGWGSATAIWSPGCSSIGASTRWTATSIRSTP